MATIRRFSRWVFAPLLLLFLATACSSTTAMKFTINGSIEPVESAAEAPGAATVPTATATEEAVGEPGPESLVGVTTTVMGKNSTQVITSTSSVTGTEPITGAGEPGAAAPTVEMTVFDIPTVASLPQGLLTMPDGSVWVAQGGADKLGLLGQPFDSEPGDAIGPVANYTEFPVSRVGVESEPGAPATAFPLGIASDMSGNIWVSLKEANELMRINPVNNTIDRLALPTAHCHGTVVKLDPGEEFMWVPESTGNKLARIEIATSKITEFDLTTPDSSPLDVDVSPRDGMVYFTAVDANYIGRLDPNTGEIKELALPTADSGPTTLVFDDAGMLWATLIDANKIARIDTESGEITEFEAPEPNSAPGMIRKSPDGTLYFTAMYGNYLAEIDEQSGAMMKFDMPMPNISPIDVPGGPPNSSGPASISFGKDGAIWVTNMFSSQVTKVMISR